MSGTSQTGLQCLSAIARHHGVDLPAEKLVHKYAVDAEPVSATLLLRMAKEAGFRASRTRMSWKTLTQLGSAYPAMTELDNGNWVVIAGTQTLEDGETPGLRVFDPLAESAEPLILAEEQFCKRWTGRTILIKRDYRFSDPDRPFGFGWFVPELLRQRRLFGDVAIAALLLYALGLATPIFFQIVIDKVLVHESYSTLYVLVAGICLALIFEAIFTFLRRYLLLYATNKIDVRIATRTFGHLVSLPIAFFEQASAGVLIKHMQQAGRVREFLTGRLFLTVLDALSLIVFLPVLFLYSTKLTMVVLAFTALVACVVGGLIGPYRKRLLELYEIEGQRQAALVETMHGMRTVKSMSMEPLQQRNWDNRSAQAVDTRFRVEKISTIAQSATGLVEKLMSVAIIGIGALDVFNGTLSVGALVAFNMLASRVSGPLVQIVNMVHEYQDVVLSVRMLGEIMNRKPERPPQSHGLRPKIKGSIEFQNVSFRYGADGAPALDDVSFTVPPSSIFGVVGKSGSGKTTVTRLIQGLYPVQHGVVRIDGIDAREIDLVHLRKNIGVVLQDNFLFRGTVRDNIAGAKPGATIDEVAEAARMAGADEFIERLPRGFETLIEENAENLSGGQKQRLAIARALITDPSILIFDEATSALDPESEMIIRKNLERIAAGRTVVIVSHRLSTLVDANSILVIDRGRLSDIGSHDQLLSRCMTYRHLWNQQTRQSA